eukprot:12893362-Prorocentrum_lima.AAC.1
MSAWTGGQWQTLWGQLACITTGPLPPLRDDASAKAKRVHTLAAAGEESRAMASLAAAPPAPRTLDTLEELQ